MENKKSPIIPFLKGDEHKAFTLVELIVVITILAILGTIAFISFQGYTRDARDAQRMSALANMKKVLSLYITTNGEYPLPSNGEDITDDGDIVWTQGTFGDTVRAKLGNRANISDIPYDPLTYNEYSYSITNTKNEYEIAVVFEGDISYNTSPLLNNNRANALGIYGTTKLDGDYNGKVLKTGDCNALKVYAVPSIIKSNTGSTDLKTILDGKQLVYDNSKILPASYSGTTNFIEELPEGDIVNIDYLQVFTGTCDDLAIEVNQQTFIDNLQQAYSGTVVSDTEKIGPIVNDPTLYISQTIIHNYVDNDVKVTASNTSSSSLSSGPDLTGKCAISQDPNVEVTFDDTYKDDISYYGTGFYIQSNTCLKWQASETSGLAWAKECSTDGDDNNYCGDYTDPEWNGSEYNYNGHYPDGGSENDFEVHKYCESLGAGWRVPTKREFMSIMTDTKPSGMSYYTALPSISNGYYWSSTTYANNPRFAWNGNFNFGSMHYFDKDYTYTHTICIHD